jgi:hypothetical protein
VVLTKGRISQLITNGLPVRTDGQIDVAEGLSWIEANLDPARRNKGGAGSVNPARSGTTLADAKRLHEIVKVQRAKLAYEKEQGLLIETAAATRTVDERQPSWPVPTTTLAGGSGRKTGMPVWRAAPPA